MKRSRVAFAICGFLGALALGERHRLSCSRPVQSPQRKQKLPNMLGQRLVKPATKKSTKAGKTVPIGSRPLKKAALPSTAAKIVMVPALPT